MHYLFQKCLKIGKLIRSNLFLAHNQVTIPKVLFEMAQQLLKDLTSQPILLIGNSEINRRVISYFKRRKVDQLTLCTRSPMGAQELATKEGLTLLPWEELSAWQRFPLVICASNAPHYLVKGASETLATQLIFDLSVPRTVDPALGTHPQLTLLNMEELGGLIETRQRKNAQQIEQAEMMILDSVQSYLYAFRQKEKRVIACA
jgi:glutamyl-tRNA reductase